MSGSASLVGKPHLWIGRLIEMGMSPKIWARLENEVDKLGLGSLFFLAKKLELDSRALNFSKSSVKNAIKLEFGLEN